MKVAMLLTALGLAAAPLAAQGELIRDSVHSRGLEGNLLGDGATREVLIYLPPSYRSAPGRRYPVLYFLHGTTSKPVEWIDGTYAGLDLRTAMDSLIRKGTIGEFIVVMPDADNALGGAFYVNSSVAGRWGDFISKDLVRHIDRRYRTRPGRADRALAGHSMGGFGALVVGLGHPERFGLLYAMSPCCTLAESPAILERRWLEVDRIDSWQGVMDASGGAQSLISLAFAFSPAPGQRRRYGALPFERDSTGGLRQVPTVFERWRVRLPAGLASKLGGRRKAPLIHLELGSAEAASSVGASVRELAATLECRKIHYTLTTFDGGHSDRTHIRVSEHLLPAVGRFFAGR